MTARTIRHRLVGLLVAAAAICSLAPAAAQAAATYTPSGGPGVSISGQNVVFDFPLNAQRFTCPSFAFGGTVRQPGLSRAFGAPAADLSTITSATCTNPVLGSSSFTPLGTWALAVLGPAGGTAYPISIGPIDTNLVTSGCSLRLQGSLGGTLDTATGAVALGPSGLTVTSTSGATCLALDWQVGDPVEVRGQWSSQPPPGSVPLVIS